MTNVHTNIKRLVNYACDQKLMSTLDYDYAINRLIALFNLDFFEDNAFDLEYLEEPSPILEPLLDYACQEGLIEVDTVLNRDIFEARIMDCVLVRPSQVIQEFNSLKIKSPQKATDYFYHVSKKSNYIKTKRTNKNVHFKAPTEYGLIDITINLSKPEKDPRDIMNQSKQSVAYPKCVLCKENVGFQGKPGRSSHRVIPLNLAQDGFVLQYSPYVYYNEHCIVLQDKHTPMNVSIQTFKRLFDFVEQFPHYFLGSNAGLPIVGGSILAHEHYQGGNYHFAMEDAKVLESFEHNGVTIEQLYWPLSVLRLRSKNKDQVIDYASKLYDYWKDYSDESVGIYAYTDAPHNAITPIARLKDGFYEIDMTLRNNLTSEEFPLGIFHPHPEQHHIKKENIGLIEVMGLAVLPARLLNELEQVKQAVATKTPLEGIHSQWVEELIKIYDSKTDIDQFIETQVANKFVKCIEDAGVFKQDELGKKAFQTFIRGFINVLK
jgi:UDPglucose--hexose-1-phosphate uridylyltransferase